MAEVPSIHRDGDGVYLQVPRGFPGRLSQVVAYVRQELPGLNVDWTAVRESYLYGRDRRFPIASRRPEAALNEKAKVRFSRDGLEAYLLLYPPKPRGERLDEAAVTALTAAYGIPHDLLDAQALRMAMLRRSHQEPEPIAWGRPPVDGGAATIRWSRGLPSDPEGFLDALQQQAEYPDVVLAEVEPGEVVGKRTPPEAGTPGLSVTGRATPARPGADPIRFGGGLALSPDSRAVVAQEAGHLRRHGGALPGAEVFPVLHVRDPQELRAWSDAVFPGSIIVDNDLELPFPVCILGDLEVRGGVIRTSIEVMGSLFVRDGIIQQRLSPLRVGGIVSAAFFERADVIAHTVHVRRYSLKSRLVALDRVVAGPDSNIKGGQVASLGSLSVGILGSRNAIATEVLVAHPTLLEPFQETFGQWAELLQQDDPEGNPAPPALQEAAASWQARAQALEQPDPLESLVCCEEINPGVTVRFGPANREMQSTVGPLEMRYERIGSRGRVSITRL